MGKIMQVLAALHTATSIGFFISISISTLFTSRILSHKIARIANINILGSSNGNDRRISKRLKCTDIIKGKITPSGV